MAPRTSSRRLAAARNKLTGEPRASRIRLAHVKSHPERPERRVIVRAVGNHRLGIDDLPAGALQHEQLVGCGKRLSNGGGVLQNVEREAQARDGLERGDERHPGPRSLRKALDIANARCSDFEVTVRSARRGETLYRVHMPLGGGVRGRGASGKIELEVSATLVWEHLENLA